MRLKILKVVERRNQFFKAFISPLGAAKPHSPLAATLD
jgi:hypothetical protein